VKAGEQRVAKLLCRPALLSGRRLRVKVLALSNVVEDAAQLPLLKPSRALEVGSK
jgi:hypothetical protein